MKPTSVEVGSLLLFMPEAGLLNRESKMLCKRPDWRGILRDRATKVLEYERTKGSTKVLERSIGAPHIQEELALFAYPALKEGDGCAQTTRIKFLNAGEKEVIDSKK